MPTVTFIIANGASHSFSIDSGKTLLDVAMDNGIDIEGTCGGVMACSTCHVVVDPVWVGKLAEPSAEEEALLGLAWGLAETSRLGCQITVTALLDGLVVSLPDEKEEGLAG
jgi:2Fe-2S ferredoxin